MRKMHLSRPAVGAAGMQQEWSPQLRGRRRVTNAAKVSGNHRRLRPVEAPLPTPLAVPVPDPVALSAPTPAPLPVPSALWVSEPPILSPSALSRDPPVVSITRGDISSLLPRDTPVSTVGSVSLLPTAPDPDVEPLPVPVPEPESELPVPVPATPDVPTL